MQTLCNRSDVPAFIASNALQTSEKSNQQIPRLPCFISLAIAMGKTPTPPPPPVRNKIVTSFNQELHWKLTAIAKAYLDAHVHKNGRPRKHPKTDVTEDIGAFLLSIEKGRPRKHPMNYMPKGTVGAEFRENHRLHSTFERKMNELRKLS